MYENLTAQSHGMEANSMFDSFQRRVAAARQSNQLFFAALVPENVIASAFGEAAAILDSARVYTTAVTLWTFLTQVLSSDHGCVNAVAKLIAFRASKALSIPSAETGGYCIARDKLDEDAMHRTLCQTGQTIDQAASERYLWLGHRVIVGDGTTVQPRPTCRSLSSSMAS